GERIQANFHQDVRDLTLPTDMADWDLEHARTWWLEFRKPRIAPGTLAPEGYRLKPLISIIGNMKEITNVHFDNRFLLRTSHLSSGFNHLARSQTRCSEQCALIRQLLCAVLCAVEHTANTCNGIGPQRMAGLISAPICTIRAALHRQARRLSSAF